jgi:hypothetical protein
MKQKLTCIAVILVFSSISQKCFTQSPSLNSLVNFVVFSSIGALTNSGASQINGDIGTNAGAITGFLGSVNGTIYSVNATTTQAAADLTNLYNQLNAATPTSFPTASIGNGDEFTAGVYKISSVLAISGNLTLNAQGNANAIFIFQNTGALNATAGTKIILINGAKASNVFWVPEGAVTIGAQSFIRGTILAHNGAITMNSHDTLEGRLFSTAGAITIDIAMIATNVSGSVTGGGSGGTESKTLGDVLAVRLYGNAINSLSMTGINLINFTHSGVMVDGVNSLALADLVPATVVNTDAAYVTTPSDLVNFTNAVEVLAVDYSKGNSTKAVAFGTKTLGNVYSHTKPICDRLKGAELMEVKNITVNGFNLVAFKLRQRTGETEYAINLSAGTAANRNSISLQSNWLTDSYQQDEKLYNFQLWAVSYEMVTAMATDIIAKLQLNGTVNTVTIADLPKAYISKGSRVGTNLTVTVKNNTANTSGYFEFKEKANEVMSDAQIITRQIPFTVNANGTCNVTVPVSDSYEGNIYVYLNNKLTDLVYLSDGTWSLNYNKQTTSISKFDITNESNVTTNSNELRMFRNVAVTGVSKDYITIYKTMMGGGLEQNISAFKSLLFTANTTGTDSVTVILVKKSIIDWKNQYTYTMELDGDKEYGIYLNQFTSKSNSSNIDANDITAVNFSFNNSTGVPKNMNISLSKARFASASIATDISVNTIGIYPNPTIGKFTTSFTSTNNQSLVLKVTEAATGRVVKTQFINATKGSNQVAVDHNLASGLYIVTLEGDNVKLRVAKLIIGKKY